MTLCDPDPHQKVADPRLEILLAGHMHAHNPGLAEAGGRK